MEVNDGSYVLPSTLFSAVWGFGGGANSGFYVFGFSVFDAKVSGGPGLRLQR